MKDKLFEPYYKLGFDHIIFKKYLGLKSPKRDVVTFYFSLILLIIAASILIG